MTNRSEVSASISAISSPKNTDSKLPRQSTFSNNAKGTMTSFHARLDGESPRRVFCSSAKNCTQVSIPVGDSPLQFACGPINCHVFHRRFTHPYSTSALYWTQHPEPFSVTPPLVHLTPMIGGAPRYLGRDFEVLSISSKPVDCPIYSTRGVLKFKDGSMYQFITYLDGFEVGDEYCLSQGSLDSLPPSLEVLRITETAGGEVR